MPIDFSQYQFSPVANNVKVTLNGGDIPLNDFIVQWGSSTGVRAKQMDGNTQKGNSPGVNKISYKPSFVFTVNLKDQLEFELMIGDSPFMMSFIHYPVGTSGTPVMTENFIQCAFAGSEIRGDSGSAATLVAYQFVCIDIVRV